MAVVALALWVGQVSAADPQVHEGKVVKAEPGKLTMIDKEGKNQFVHAIPADAKITFDGKACKIEDLKPGTAVKVTTEKKDNKDVVTSVEGSKAP
jgi:hypothetical protein